MAKVHTRKPDPRIFIVSDESNDGNFEVWLAVPQLIGSMTRIGKNAYETQDGVRNHANMPAAVQHILYERGLKDIAAKAGQYLAFRPGRVQTAPTVPPISGAELLRMRKWYEFCDGRGIDPGDTKAMNATYHLTAEERTRLGVDRT